MMNKDATDINVVTKDGDVIYRQQAIDIIEDFPHGGVWNVESMEEMVYRIKQLPSAPEREAGEWIYDGDGYKCNKCGTVYGWWADSQTSNFCPNCGADMREGQDDSI